MTNPEKPNDKDKKPEDEDVEEYSGPWKRYK